MTRFAHLSDLHFGAHDPRLVRGVTEQLLADPPDLVVVSGDFTQRARTEQFQEACRFLAGLRDQGLEVIGVPGNHDVPLYDVIRRFLSPLTRYRKYVDETLCPLVELPGATVLGINTARSLAVAEGRINREQMALIRDVFAAAAPGKARVLVTHHPLFSLTVGDDESPAVGRHEQALEVIAEAGVELLLAGHHHQASQHSARDLVTRAGPALVVQAGTATSVRLRDEPASFNRIDLRDGAVVVTVLDWNGDLFVPREAVQYLREGDHWRRGESVAPAGQTVTARHD